MHPSMLAQIQQRQTMMRWNHVGVSDGLRLNLQLNCDDSGVRHCLADTDVVVEMLVGFAVEVMLEFWRYEAEE